MLDDAVAIVLIPNVDNMLFVDVGTMIYTGVDSVLLVDADTAVLLTWAIYYFLI